MEGQESIESGLQSILTETSGSSTSKTVKADYVVLFIDGRFLIVKAPPGTSKTTKEFSGALVPLPEDIRRQIVGQVYDQPDIASAFFPDLMLDATGFRDQGYWAIGICVPILLVATWNFRNVYIRRQDPQTHPILKLLAGYGSIPQVAMNIDSDLHAPRERMGDATVTASWILNPKFFELRICHIPDIVWAYLKVTKHSVNLIPTGKTYAAVIFSRNRVPTEVDGGEDAIAKLLQTIASRAPWAVIGFTKELDKAIRADWSGFVADIDQRRAAASVTA